MKTKLLIILASLEVAGVPSMVSGAFGSFGDLLFTSFVTADLPCFSEYSEHSVQMFSEASTVPGTSSFQFVQLLPWQLRQTSVSPKYNVFPPLQPIKSSAHAWFILVLII